MSWLGLQIVDSGPISSSQRGWGIGTRHRQIEIGRSGRKASRSSCLDCVCFRCKITHMFTQNSLHVYSFPFFFYPKKIHAHAIHQSINQSIDSPSVSQTEHFAQ